jgi:hypothetical protein
MPAAGAAAASFLCICASSALRQTAKKAADKAVSFLQRRGRDARERLEVSVTQASLRRTVSGGVGCGGSSGRRLGD